MERYEYDAYGTCRIMEPNFADDPDGKSNYGNSYLFTGRRLDILDSGSLKIQYNRNRYYDPYTGRWLTHDPLGLNAAKGKAAVERHIKKQYWDGLNLYSYAQSRPTNLLDPAGLYKCAVKGSGKFVRPETDPFFQEFWSEHILEYKWEKKYDCTEYCSVSSGDEKVTYSNVHHIPDSIGIPPVFPIGIYLEEKAVIVSTNEVSIACKEKTGTKHIVTLIIGDEISLSLSFIWTWTSPKILETHEFKFVIDCCCSRSCGKIKWIKGPHISE